MKSNQALTISHKVQTSLKNKYSNILLRKEILNVAGLYTVFSKGIGKSVKELDNIIEFTFENGNEIYEKSKQSLIN